MLIQDIQHIELIAPYLKSDIDSKELYVSVKDEMNQKNYPSIQLDKSLVKKESFNVNLSPDENELIQLFRNLDVKNQKEIISIIRIKQGKNIIFS